MPRLVATDGFKGGIIYARIQDLNIISAELQKPATLTFAELERIREHIDSLDAAVRSLRRDVIDNEIRKMIRSYEEKCEIVIDLLDRRERNAGRQVEESEAMRAARLRDPDLDMYASDGTHHVPISSYAVLTSTSRYQPANAQDLREQLNRRREGETLRGFDEPTTSDGQQRPRRGHRTSIQDQPAQSHRAPPDEPLYGGDRYVVAHSARRQREASSSSSVVPHQRPRHRSPSVASTVSIRTSTSHASAATGSSYRSSQMQHARGPQRDVPLPPFLPELPYPIQAGDQALIGMTEIYAQRASRNCPMCHGDHRMIRCPGFNGLSLVDRWYQALLTGVCLHCLRHGHSSFRCFVEGNCAKCLKPHNSLLCPRNPANTMAMD